LHNLYLALTKNKIQAKLDHYNLIEEKPMEDLINLMENTAPKLPEFTVSEISFEIKRFVETNFAHVRIRGEIFGGKRADSGHWYLSLKDENAVLSAVIWKGTASRLTFKPEDGLEVIATGKITTFAGKSSYQLVIEQMEVAGTGALLKLLEERKKKFAEEGLFDPAHKKAIPYLPQVIGVVTSASGAVIRDIIHRIRDRCPSRILVWPTPVQGEGAAEKIASAVAGFNSLPENGIPRPDVIIVARGGGSLEDLWPFNEEVVIRAVYDSQIPVISAVGHETDTMLIDYVSDKRAPTPTGAAEFAVPVKAELSAQIATLKSRLSNGTCRYFSERQNQLEALRRGIPNLSQILSEITQRFDDRIERLNLAFQNLLANKRSAVERIALKPYYIKNIFDKNQEILKNLALRLESVSIDSVLKRGFAWVRDDKEHTIYNLQQAKQATALEIRFHDGTIVTRTDENKQEQQSEKKHLTAPQKTKKAVQKNDEIQISLFDF